MPAFKDLNLKINNSTSTFTLNDQTITVRKHIPLQDKIDLIQITLQKSEEDGIYNELKLQAYFELNYIYLYTDIEFSDEDRLDELALWDRLNDNEIIQEVLIAQQGAGDYSELLDALHVMMDRNLAYKNTAAAVLNRIVTDLPANAQAAKEIVDSFDAEKYSQVVNFAQAANGNRPIGVKPEIVE